MATLDELNRRALQTLMRRAQRFDRLREPAAAVRRGAGDFDPRDNGIFRDQTGDELIGLSIIGTMTTGGS